MPSTLTKKCRLSTGFGVSSSIWAKWARSNERSVDCKATLAYQTLSRVVPDPKDELTTNQRPEGLAILRSGHVTWPCEEGNAANLCRDAGSAGYRRRDGSACPTEQRSCANGRVDFERRPQRTRKRLL